MKDKDKNEKKDKIYYIIFGVIVCIALTIIAFAMLTQKPNEENPKEISYTELITINMEASLQFYFLLSQICKYTIQINKQVIIIAIP